ncbi:MAG: hypothetical protein Q4D62_12815 [Planctomycetia bacterium]|nr:hypothetical protein [Planctomycetia bacterium]
MNTLEHGNRKKLYFLGILGLFLAVLGEMIPVWAEEPTAETTYRLVSQRKAGDVDLVQKEIDVAGRLVIYQDAAGESVSRPALSEEASSRQKERKIPLKIHGEQEYEETLITQGNLLQGEQGKPTLGAWYFLKDETSIQIDSETATPHLKPEQPLMGVDIHDAEVHIFRPDGLLTREEKDLVDLQGNTLLLDFLLPNRGGMKIGDSWKQSPDTIALLLQLDLIFQLDVQTKLLEVKKGIAILETSGWVEGSSDGTSSKMDVTGKMYFDLNRGRIVWFGMLIRENRAAGYVAPGMEVVARLQYRIRPLKQPQHLTESVVSNITFDNTRYDQLLFEDVGQVWRCVLDSSWYATTWNERQATFRMVRGGNLIAQCSVASPINVQETQDLSLEAFAENIQKTLGAGFGEIVEQTETLRDDGTRIYRIDVSGKVDELPLRWIYYLLTRKGEKPLQETVVFTVEEKLLEDFGSADSMMIESFEWASP